MTSEQTTFAYFRERWKPIAATIAAVVVLILMPLAAITDLFGDEYRVEAAWPTRLSNDTAVVLPITLTGADSKTDLSGDVVVYYGETVDQRSFPKALADGAFKELARGETDRNGRAILELPPVEPLPDDQRPALLLHVEAAGEEHWSSRNLDSVDAPVLALTLDRPLYQPGQTIMMRGLVASATSGKPLDTDATFRVRDARGNLVMETTVPTGPDGVAAAELQLADRCVQGTYDVELSARDKSRSTTVEVAPYQLPRFTVSVVPQNSAATPGDEVVATVRAMFTYGEPVVDADVSVSAEVGDIELPSTSGKTGADGSFFATFELPRNVGPGQTIAFRANVTSVTGRTQPGTATLNVAGRNVRVELIPAGEVSFQRDAPQRGYAVVADQDGPVVGASVSLTLPESDAEKTTTVVTDAKGRAEFQWQAPNEGYSYASVSVVADDAVVFKQNIHLSLSADRDLQLSASVLDVGDTLGVQAAQREGIVVMMRDGVTLMAAKLEEGAASLVLPPTSAGYATVGVMRGGSIESLTPVWIRQQGGDEVSITLPTPDVRPGAQTEVQLSFPAAENAGTTFGLVAVDEALYALKERASVPLYILMRRAPTSIFSALAAFDDVDDSDRTDVEIATHKFRTIASTDSAPYLGGNSLDSTFERHGRRWPLRVMGWMAMLGLLFVVVQLVRITRQAAKERPLFTWKRAGQLAATTVLCGLFASALGAGSGESLVGGLSVWAAVVGCWLVAAAIRVPGLRFDEWLLLHVIAVALGASAAICATDLATGRAPDAVLLQVGVALPLVLLTLQWFVWVLVLLREQQLHAGLGAGSFAGIGLFGTLAMSVMTVGYRYEDGGLPMASKQYAMMEESADMEARPSPAPSAPPPAGGAVMKPKDAPRVRSWFPETMIWLPEIAADSSGNASVSVEVPDSITTWRLNAWANTSDGRFGQGQAQLRTIQPYFVELDLPFEVTDGDRFEVPVTFVNRAETELQIDFDVQTTGPIAARGARDVPRTVPAGGRQTAWLNLVATGVGAGEVTVTSTTNGEEGDAVKRPIRVAPDGRVLRQSSSAIVGEGWEHRVSLPPDAIDGTRHGEVRVFGSIIADALSGLDSMLREPNGCFEQTSSANYPNVMVLRAMRDMTPSDWPDGEQDFVETRDRAEELVRLGYQRIVSFQKPGGGFALYPERAEPSPMLTAYGILQLTWASEVTTVDPAVIARAARWLVQQQNEDGSWPRSHLSGSSGGSIDIGHARSTAFAVMALAAVNKPEFREALDKALVRLEQRIDAIESPNSLAFVTAALSDAGSKRLATKAATQLAAAATRDGQVAYWNSEGYRTWMGGYGNIASVETTALATYALLITESQPELLQPALTWLSQRRGAYGGFGSTQATVWTLRTLETLRSKSANDATLRFYFDAEQLQTIAGAKELQVTAGAQPLRQFGFTPAQNEGRFLVDSSASTTAMVQLVSEVAVDWDSRFANVDGEPFGGEVEVERTTSRGGTVRAYARIENLAETPASSVIVEAPVPPGAFVPKESLDTLMERGAIDHYEVLPTHVRFYVSAVPGRAQRVFAYDFIPLIRGSFSLPPLRAYPFYTPEPRMEVDAGDLRTR